MKNSNVRLRTAIFSFVVLASPLSAFSQNCTPIQVKIPAQSNPTVEDKTKNPQAVSDLFEAVFDKDLNATLKILKTNNVSVTDGDQNSWNVLMFSAKAGPDITRALLDYGFSPNMGSDAPLVNASNVDLATFQVFLDAKYGVDVNQTNPFGQTALMAAAQNNRTDIIDSLMNACADVDATTVVGNQSAAGYQKMGDTALHLASKWCSETAVADLLKWKAKTDILDTEGSTALIVSSMRCPALGQANANNIIADLVNGGSPINTQNSAGYSALMGVAAAGDLSAVQYLIRHGADASLKTTGGVLGFGKKTAKDLADEQGHQDVADYLSQQTK